MFRCALKVVVHITLLTFAFFVYERSWYRRKVDESAWAMEGRGWKRNCYHCIIWSFAQVTNKLDLFFLPSFPFHKKMHKRHCYLALGPGKVSDLEVHPVLIWSSHVLNLCTVLHIIYGKIIFRFPLSPPHSGLFGITKIVLLFNML